MQDVKRLNTYFVDKEEEVIIWLQQLDEQLSSAATLRDRQICHIGYIHLHGQLVLLFHWSMLNYAALVKILKKHGARAGCSTTLSAPVGQLAHVCAIVPLPVSILLHVPRSSLQQVHLLSMTCFDADKVSGREVKAPVLSNALKQPFSTTGMLSSLMAKCEAKARELEDTTGGLESLLKACPEYQGLFLVKYASCVCAQPQHLAHNVCRLPIARRKAP